MSEPKRNAPRPHGPGRGMMPTEKAKDFKGSFKKLISYLSPFKFKILIVVIFAALSTAFDFVKKPSVSKITTLGLWHFKISFSITYACATVCRPSPLTYDV